MADMVKQLNYVWLTAKITVLPPLNSSSALPYTAKLSRGETFAVFMVFQPIAKVFPLNHLPCTVHNGMDLMHHENFPVNSVFCAQPRKFCRMRYSFYHVFR